MSEQLTNTEAEKKENKIGKPEDTIFFAHAMQLDFFGTPDLVKEVEAAKGVQEKARVLEDFFCLDSTYFAIETSQSVMQNHFPMSSLRYIVVGDDTADDIVNELCDMKDELYAVTALSVSSDFARDSMLPQARVWNSSLKEMGEKKHLNNNFKPSESEAKVLMEMVKSTLFVKAKVDNAYAYPDSTTGWEERLNKIAASQFEKAIEKCSDWYTSPVKEEKADKAEKAANGKGEKKDSEKDYVEVKDSLERGF